MAPLARYLAWTTLLKIHRGAYADVALHNVLHPLKPADLKGSDRALVTELVYGCIRRQRTLDALVQQLSRQAQPPSLELRVLLHLGLYQLRYLHHIPTPAVVHTTVELCKHIRLPYATGFVNAVLRQYDRQAQVGDVLQYPEDPLEAVGIRHSYPRWILETWRQQLDSQKLDSQKLNSQELDLQELEHLCQWLNQAPTLDLRVNPLRTTPDQVQTAFAAAGLSLETVPGLPNALTLPKSVGAIPHLPGFQTGHWMVQDRSAQLVSHWLDPQPGETIADACAAPGGKTTHIAELMGDQGHIFAYDPTPSRLKKIEENRKRLGLTSIQICQGDSRHQPHLVGTCDRVLVDAPCSGLGTLHRHADARWTQTPQSVQELVELQRQILNAAATWVKPGGVLVYATCTLHPAENEDQIEAFLGEHPQWRIELPPIAQRVDHPQSPWSLDHPQCLKLWPHRSQMDGFFMVRLKNGG